MCLNELRQIDVPDPISLLDHIAAGHDKIVEKSADMDHIAAGHDKIVEKSADMRYNKLLNFAGVTGDFDDSRFRERNAYEKWKKT